jgi:nucleotide-binding universal stress UspA family protein
MNSVPPSRTQSAEPCSRVLIAVDSSAASQRALQYACHVVPSRGAVHLVSVAENPRTLLPTGRLAGAALEAARAELLRDATDALVRARDVFANRDVRVETRSIDLSKQSGDVAGALLETARAWHADLMVLGARQHHGILRWVEGTVSEPLSRSSPCPLLIVPESFEDELPAGPRKMLFAVDGSEQAKRALRYGVALATPDADLRAIYVVDCAVRLADFIPIHVFEEAFVQEGTAALADAERILSSVGRQCTAAMVRTGRTSDDVANAIIREAGRWGADLLVMGTHGRRGVVRWMLGSVAGRVARVTPVPLLLVNTRER